MMNTRVFAARLKNFEQVEKSSSGGMFTAISDYFLQNNNAIISAIYNYTTNQTEYKLYFDEKTRNEARGSKYMQAHMQNIFQDAKKWLENNKGNLLFVGMGCQADAFRKYAEMKNFRNRVIIVDIICHGSSSPKIWRDYIEKFAPISKLEFRNKRNGWARPTSLIIKGKKEIEISDYMKLFYSRCALRPSCYSCPYATTNRKVDITIGDFWGIEKAIPDFKIENGVSLVLIHTEEGIKIWDLIKNNLIWKESNIHDCLQPNLVGPTQKSENRELFWETYRKFGIKRLLKKYGNESIKTRIKTKIKKILKLLHVYK